MCDGATSSMGPTSFEIQVCSCELIIKCRYRRIYYFLPNSFLRKLFFLLVPVPVVAAVPVVPPVAAVAAVAAVATDAWRVASSNGTWPERASTASMSMNGVFAVP